MNVAPEHIDLSIPALSQKIRIIEMVPDQVTTHASIDVATIMNGKAVADPRRDLAKLAVVERHQGTGNVGLAFARGTGLKTGAIASSVAHDSHNLIVLGVEDGDMIRALKEIAGMGGGLAVVNAGEVTARLPLPIAGLMSEDPLSAVRDQLDHVLQAAHKQGITLQDPFMALSFLALPVIPDLKLTDRGLVDVKAFKMVPLFV
jgi:adenine deaminase